MDSSSSQKQNVEEGEPVADLNAFFQEFSARDHLSKTAVHLEGEIEANAALKRLLSEQDLARKMLYDEQAIARNRLYDQQALDWNRLLNEQIVSSTMRVRELRTFLGPKDSSGEGIKDISGPGTSASATNIFATIASATVKRKRAASSSPTKSPQKKICKICGGDYTNYGRHVIIMQHTKAVAAKEKELAEETEKDSGGDKQ